MTPTPPPSSAVPTHPHTSTAHIASTATTCSVSTHRLVLLPPSLSFFGVRHPPVMAVIKQAVMLAVGTLVVLAGSASAGTTTAAAVAKGTGNPPRP